MMHQSLRLVTAAGFLGSMSLGLVSFGCGTSLGPVRATQSGGVDNPNLPDITVERAKECVAEYGSQLEPGYHRFDSKVRVDEEGYKKGVTIEDIPDTAPDFGACMRNVLRDMPIAEEPFRQGMETLKYQRTHPSPEQRALVGHPVVIVVAGVTIVVSELVLEAGATTILFAVTVKLVDKAAKDIVEKVEEEGWKAKCAAHYATCMATTIAGKKGNHWQQTRCGICLAACTEDAGWPDKIGNGSCAYWRRNWR